MRALGGGTRKSMAMVRLYPFYSLVRGVEKGNGGEVEKLESERLISLSVPLSFSAGGMS